MSGCDYSLFKVRHSIAFSRYTTILNPSKFILALFGAGWH